MGNAVREEAQTQDQVVDGMHTAAQLSRLWNEELDIASQAPGALEMMVNRKEDRLIESKEAPIKQIPEEWVRDHCLPCSEIYSLNSYMLYTLRF